MSSNVKDFSSLEETSANNFIRLVKLPGDAWLELKIIEKNEKKVLKQTATFRPKGLLGRMYWYSVLPLHYFVFNGMAENIIKYEKNI